jgi:fibronectin-binding autotransporter adhesin
MSQGSTATRFASALFGLLFLFLFVWSVAIAGAANGTWTQASPGTFSWDDTTRWLGGVPADGLGATANFNTVNPTDDITINLDVLSHTVGSMTFGDTDPSSAAGWTITSINSNSLSLDNSPGPAATITVNNLGAGKIVNINAPFFAFSGLTKAGPGTLALTNASTTPNAIGGVVTVSGGTLQVSTGSLGAIDVVNNANLTFDQAAAATYANTVSGSGSLTKTGAGVLTVTPDQTYTGATVVNGGGLTVQGNLASQSLTLGGGTLTLSSSGATPVNFSLGTTINGPSTVNASAVLGTAALGAITRNAGGAINFTLPTTAPGVITTTSANVNGILGGWATVGGSDYATSNAGTIAAYTGYTNDTWAAGNNTKITQATSSQSSATTSTLRIGGDFASDHTFTAAAAGNTIVVDSATGLQVGTVVTGTGIPADTRIIAVNGTTITLSRNVPVTAGATTLNYGASGATAAINLSGTNSIAAGGILTNIYSPATTFNGGSLSGAAGGGDVIFHQFATASGNMTVNSTIVNNGGATGVVKNGSGTVLLNSDNSYTGNISVGGGNLTLAGNNSSAANTTIGSGATLQVGNGGSTGAINMAGTITNNGTLAFNRSGSLAITKKINGSGGVTFSGGLAATLDFTAAGAPASDLLTTGGYTMTGGAGLTVNGKANAASVQNFASSTFGSGLSTITVNNGSGTGTAAVNLGTLSAQIGSAARFLGPTTQDAAGSPVVATGFLNTNAAGTGASNALGTSNVQGLAGAGWATVGLYDFAGTVADPLQPGVFNIVGGSQIPAFYTTTYPNNSGTNSNVDLIANVTAGGNERRTGTIRFNTPAAITFTAGNSALVTNQAFLITPNVAANNVLFNAAGSGVYQVVRSTTAGSQEGLIWQNNTLGFFEISAPIINGRSGTTNPTFIVKAGPGTLVLSSGTSAYTGTTSLLEGSTLISSNTNLGSATISVASSSTTSNIVNLAAGAPNSLVVGSGFLGQTITAISGTVVTLSGNANQTITAATNVTHLPTVVLNGGNLVGRTGNFELGTGGALSTGRPVSMQGAGGTLAATTGNRLTISGQVFNGATNAGPLTIGTGAIAGTGAGTANATLLTGNGQVALTNANTYTGGTVINSGTLLVNNLSGSGTGTGSITVNSGGTLGGNGTASGAVSILSGGHLAPGTSTGTLTVGGLSMATGSIYDAELSPAANDRLVSLNGLTIGSGTGVNLFNSGTTDPYSINGLFTLFTVNSGSFPNAAALNSSLSILNPVAGGTYLWGTSGNNITLQISGLGDIATWNVNGGGTWGTAGNWSPAVVPNSVFSGASFGNSVTAPGTVNITLDGNKTVGSLSLSNTNGASYAIVPGSGGNLVFDNSASAATINVGTGSHSIAANVVLNSNLIASVNSSLDVLTISGNISGAKNFTAAGGNGKVVLTGTNSYANTTIGNGMTLQVGTGGASGTLGTGTISNNGTLNINVSGPTSLNELTGTGSLIQSGTGATTLVGTTNSGTWSTTVSAGSLIVGTGSSLGSGALAVNGGLLNLNGYSPSATSLSGTGGTIDNATGGGTATITVNQTGNTTFVGTIANTTGVVSLSKSGAGSLTLSGTNTYDGNTTITGGSITLASSAAVKAGTTIDVQTTGGLLLANNATVPANILLTLPNGTATAMFDVAAGSNSTITGNITQSGTAGGAQTRFNAGNDPTTTSLTITGNITTATAINDLERGSFIFAGNSVFTAPGTSGIWLGRNNGSNQVFLLKDNAQFITPSVTLAAAGTGIVNNSVVFTMQDNASINSTGTFELGGAVTTTSTVNLNGGTLKVGGFSHTSGTATVTFNGTQIIAAANNPAFFSPAVATTANVQAGGVKINSNSFNIDIAQSFNHDPALDTVTPTPDGGLSKSGAGKLTLSGFSTYNGPTTISGGTLSVVGLISGTSKVILAGGVLDTNGVAAAFGVPLQVTANSAIDMGAFGAGQMSFADSHLTPWTSGATLSIINWTGTAGVGGGTDQLAFGPGGLTTGAGSQVSQIHFQGFNGATLLGTGEVVPATISTRKLADWDVNGTVNGSDVAAMLQALTDLNAYKTSHSLTNEDFLNIADVNGSGTITNADMQATLDLIGSLGFGSLASVPEPSTFLLLGMGAALAVARRRMNRAKAAK